MQGFDLLLGSDVAYSLKALPSLFKVAASLLSKRPSSVFILGYVSRYSIFCKRSFGSSLNDHAECTVMSILIIRECAVVLSLFAHADGVMVKQRHVKLSRY